MAPPYPYLVELCPIRATAAEYPSVNAERADGPGCSEIQFGGLILSSQPYCMAGL